uniref:Uncharacterized protein n=1 Tax=Meloidogyne enterolobii TaxID=390850 RepID=A0A6V7Y5L8_MELEN|nr:unnamed protein product [Meloidogyne enterolobii]
MCCWDIQNVKNLAINCVRLRFGPSSSIINDLPIHRPPILPLFLKQALHSQLHFSPLRSWLTANTTLPCGLFPVVRVLASDHLLSNPISSQVQSHKFPACCCSTTPNGGGIWLELCVQWLKREYFLSKAPILCPSIEMDCNDSWVLPPLSDTNNGLNQEQNQRPSSSLSSSLCSSSSDSDEDIQEEDESESGFILNSIL